MALLPHLIPVARPRKRSRRKSGRRLPSEWVPWVLLGLLGLLVVCVKIWG